MKMPQCYGHDVPCSLAELQRKRKRINEGKQPANTPYACTHSRRTAQTTEEREEEEEEENRHGRGYGWGRKEQVGPARAWASVERGGVLHHQK